MLYVNPDKIVADHPAVTYLEARPMRCYDRNEDFVQLHHGDVFAVVSQRNADIHKEYTAFTIFGYAVENADDPVASWERAIKNGHETVTATGNSVSLTAWEQKKKTVGVLFVGQIVKIEGKLYTVKRTPNDNIGFDLVAE